MKLALVYDAIFPYTIGGAERRFYEIGRYLAPHHEVHLLGWQFWEGPSVLEKDGMTFIGVGKPEAFYDENGRRTLKEAIKFGAAVVPALVRGKYDVVDCSSIPYVPVLTSRATRLQANIVVTWHEYMGDRWASYLGKRGRFAAAIESMSARVGSIRVAVSEFTRRRLPYALPPKVVVPNGIALEQIEASPRLDEDLDLLYVGRLLPHKRVDLLLETLRDLSIKARLGIVGTGPEEARLQSLVERYGLSDRVKFFGAVQESAVYGAMKSAKVFVQPSEQEGQSIVVMEAMACGAVPLVLKAEHSAATDVIRHSVDGLVAESTPSALGEGIVRLLSDGGMRQSMADEARTMAKTFDWSMTAAQMQSIYLAL